jgi:hypothetical protein
MADPAAIPPPLVLGRCLWAQLTSVGCAYCFVRGASMREWNSFQIRALESRLAAGNAAQFQLMHEEKHHGP